MARGDITFFQEALAKMLDGDWAASDVFWCGLVTDAVTPTAAYATPEYDDFTEIAVAGTYSAGGISIGTLAANVTQTGAVMTFNPLEADPTWAKNASNAQDAYWAIVYNYTDANKDALCFVDLDGAVDMQAGALTIAWHASGIFTVTIP